MHVWPKTLTPDHSTMLICFTMTYTLTMVAVITRQQVISLLQRLGYMYLPGQREREGWLSSFNQFDGKWYRNRISSPVLRISRGRLSCNGSRGGTYKCWRSCTRFYHWNIEALQSWSQLYWTRVVFWRLENCLNKWYVEKNLLKLIYWMLVFFTLMVP